MWRAWQEWNSSPKTSNQRVKRALFSMFSVCICLPKVLFCFPLHRCAPDPRKSQSLGEEQQSDFMYLLFCCCVLREIVSSFLSAYLIIPVFSVTCGFPFPILSSINHMFYSNQLSREVLLTFPSPSMQISNKGS